MAQKPPLRLATPGFHHSRRQLFRAVSVLAKDQSGAAAILAAVAMPIMLAFTGLAVEVGLWYSQLRYLQSASDAAAMAAGVSKYMGGTQSAMESAASADVLTNGITSNTTAVTATSALLEVHSPPQSGAYAGVNGAVETVLTQQQNLLLARLFMTGTSQNIRVRSVTRQTTVPTCCLCSLAEDTTAITTSGNVNVTLKGCGLASNSSDPNASMTDTGTASVTADYVHLSGGLNKSGNATLTSPDIVQNGSRIGDPYLDQATPTTNGGTQVDPKIKNGESKAVDPGTYTDLTIKGTATLSPGVYVINGSLTINSGANVSGSGVTFVIANSGSVTINGQATVNISAPTSGPNAGIAFYGKNASTTQAMKFNGGASMNINGVLYFPKQQLQFNGGSTSGTTCTRVVGYKITLTGGDTTKVDCTAENGKKLTPTYPILVE